MQPDEGDPVERLVDRYLWWLQSEPHHQEMATLIFMGDLALLEEEVLRDLSMNGLVERLPRAMREGLYISLMAREELWRAEGLALWSNAGSFEFNGEQRARVGAFLDALDSACKSATAPWLRLRRPQQG